MNVDKINENAKKASERQYSWSMSNNKFSFSLLNIKSLAVGNYPCRFVWADQIKNPDGMQLVATHAIVQNNQTVESFLSPLSYKGAYDGHLRALEIIRTRGLYEVLESGGEPTKALRNAIQKLSAWRRYWLPIYMWAEEVPPAEGEKYSTFRPSNNPMAKPIDKLLEINEASKIFTAIIQSFKQFPNIDDPDVGRNFTLIVTMVGKNKTCNIKIDDQPSSLDRSMVKFASDNYPKVLETMEKIHYKDPQLTYAQIKATFWCTNLEAWWVKQQLKEGIPSSEHTLLFEEPRNFLTDMFGDDQQQQQVIPPVPTPVDQGVPFDTTQPKEWIPSPSETATPPPPPPSPARRPTPPPPARRA